MERKLEIGTQVIWAWGAHQATGRIEEIFTSDVTRTIKGTHVKRKASAEEPAYLIVQANGAQVLKSASEVHEA